MWCCFCKGFRTHCGSALSYITPSWWRFWLPRPHRTTISWCHLLLREYSFFAGPIRYWTRAPAARWLPFVCWPPYNAWTQLQFRRSPAWSCCLHIYSLLLFSASSEASSFKIMNALVYLLAGKSSVCRISTSLGMVRSNTDLWTWLKLKLLLLGHSEPWMGATSRGAFFLDARIQYATRTTAFLPIPEITNKL